MPLSCAEAASSSSPVLLPYGFIYPAGEVDRGSGGLYALGGFARANRSLEFSVRHALGEVRYRVDAATLLHEDFARAAVRRGLPRSSLPITLLGWAWRTLRRDRRGTLRRERGTRRSNVRDSAR